MAMGKHATSNGNERDMCPRASRRGQRDYNAGVRHEIKRNVSRRERREARLAARAERY